MQIWPSLQQLTLKLTLHQHHQLLPHCRAAAPLLLLLIVVLADTVTAYCDNLHYPCISDCIVKNFTMRLQASYNLNFVDGKHRDHAIGFRERTSTRWHHGQKCSSTSETILTDNPAEKTIRALNRDDSTTSTAEGLTGYTRYTVTCLMFHLDREHLNRYNIPLEEYKDRYELRISYLPELTVTKGGQRKHTGTVARGTLGIYPYNHNPYFNPLNSRLLFDCLGDHSISNLTATSVSPRKVNISWIDHQNMIDYSIFIAKREISVTSPGVTSPSRKQIPRRGPMDCHGHPCHFPLFGLKSCTKYIICVKTSYHTNSTKFFTKCLNLTTKGACASAAQDFNSEKIMVVVVGISFAFVAFVLMMVCLNMRKIKNALSHYYNPHQQHVIEQDEIVDPLFHNLDEQTTPYQYPVYATNAQDQAKDDKIERRLNIATISVDFDSDMPIVSISNGQPESEPQPRS